MSAKRLVALGKVWVLLLLFSNMVVAKTAMVMEPNTTKEVSLIQAQHAIAKDLLQPQGHTTVQMVSEHAAKLVPFGYAVLPYNPNTRLVLTYLGTTTTVLQDA